MESDKQITIMYLIDTYISPPDSHLKGGAEKQLYILSTSLDSNIFKPIVVQLGLRRSLPIVTGKIQSVELFHFPMLRLYSLNGLYQLRRLYWLSKHKKVDIIHTFFEKSEVAGWVTTRLSGIPIWITSRRDLGFKRKKIYDRIFKISAKDCQRCVANCQAVKNHVIQQSGLSDDKIEIIFNGLNMSAYGVGYNNEAFKKELGIDESISLVGMVANFYQEIKGHQYFLEAAKIVLEKVPHAEFILVGEGWLRQKYEKMSQALGIRRKIHFLGSRSDIPFILAILDVSVLSSTSEGLSNVILESMAAGKPVIATNVGGSPEMVIDGVTGNIVPPADSNSLAKAIISLLMDPEKAKAMGKSGKKVVQEKFTADSMVRSYENLYQTLMSQYK